jgi:hypothetical protein
MQKILLLLVLMCLSNLISSIEKVVNQNIKHKNKKQIINTKNTTFSIKEVINNDFKKGFLTPIFTNLKEAKNFFNYFNKDGDNVLVSFDVKINEKIVKNWFVADNRKELFNFIKVNKNAPLYEQINTKRHKLFFDVDINKGDEGFNNFNYIEYKGKLEKELTNVLNNKLNFVWLNSSCSYKKSYHLIINNVYCNINENQQIKNYLNKQLKSSFLDEVYSKNRCFRICNCSKYGEKRTLKLVNKNCSFNDTLVNIYSDDKVDKINAKIPLEQKLFNQTNFSNINVNVPQNVYLINNFVQNKNKPCVFNRKFKGASLPCPICISHKGLCKEKHHKTTDVYIFKKGNNTYLGCFRAKKWQGDRYFLNLETNKVEYVPKSVCNNISPTIFSALSTFKKSNPEDVDNEIKELLEQDVNFGKYKGQFVKDLFRDMSYVNWIMNNFRDDKQAKKVLDRLIKYFNNEYVEWDYLRFRPKTKKPTSPTSPTKSTLPTVPTSTTKQLEPTIKEMIDAISSITQTVPSLWHQMSKNELKMHYSMLKQNGCFG